MSASEAVTVTRPQWKSAALWTLRSVLAASFMLAGVLKLYAAPEIVAELDKLGLGPWFRNLLGTVQIFAGLNLMNPDGVLVGAILVMVISAGDFCLQLAVFHGDPIHDVVQIGFALFVFFGLRKNRPARHGH